MWISFSMGLPDMESVLEIEGYGRARFKGHLESGAVRVYLLEEKVYRTIDGRTKWKYEDYEKG